MKKILLGTMMILGAVAYGQGNKVVVPLNAGNGTATIGVEVEGKVFQPTEKSLVVEIKSAATPDGRGFSFQMPDMFTNQTGNAVTGRFVASIQMNGAKEAFTQAPEISLLDKNGTVQSTNINDAKTTGSANDVTLNYALTGKSDAGSLEHDGTISVQAISKTTTGNYADNTVKLLVKVTGQTM